MQTFKRLLPFLAGAVLFAALNGLLNYLIIPYQFTRMKIHRIETETFQDLILGSSHGAAALDPAVLSGASGRSCFNAAAGGQTPRDNYYLLLDALRQHAPERVVFEYDPAYWISRDGFNRTSRYQLSEMCFSSAKLRYGADLCTGGDLRYVLTPWFLYDYGIGDIRETVAVKQSEAWRTYGAEPFESSEQVCREDGFIAIRDTAEGDQTLPDLTFEGREDFVAEHRKDFLRLVRACEKNGIELVVVTTPVPETLREESLAFYSESHDLMSGLAGRFGFRFLDYVVSEGENGGTGWSDDGFSDMEGHMRMSTAGKFSALLAQDLAGAA